MGMFDFMKDAGEKIFKPGEAKREAAIPNFLANLFQQYVVKLILPRKLLYKQSRLNLF